MLSSLSVHRIEDLTIDCQSVGGNDGGGTHWLTLELSRSKLIETGVEDFEFTVFAKTRPELVFLLEQLKDAATAALQDLDYTDQEENA